MYISPFTTSRTFTVRLLPPRLPGRMSGSTWLHSSSVKSLGYRSLLRSYRARFSIVHIGGLSTTQAAILASQTLDTIQYVPEQALSAAQLHQLPPDRVGRPVRLGVREGRTGAVRTRGGLAGVQRHGPDGDGCAGRSRARSRVRSSGCGANRLGAADPRAGGLVPPIPW